eukprot:650085-Pelagomonas_calceolata.AAC.5
MDALPASLKGPDACAPLACMGALPASLKGSDACAALHAWAPCRKPERLEWLCTLACMGALS